MLSNMVLLGFLGLGGGEMILIIVALLLLFGGRKIPELMKGLGKGIKEFKDSQKDEVVAAKDKEQNDTKA